MTEISEQNTRNGWTLELVAWMEKWVSYRRPNQWKNSLDEFVSCLRPGGPRHGVVLGELPVELAELVQALPAEALEVFAGEWMSTASRVGIRSRNRLYRVKKRWEIGPYVEEEAEQEAEQDDSRGEATMKTIQDLISNALKGNNYAAEDAARPDPYGALDPLVGHAPTAYEMFQREMVAAIAQLLKLPDTKTSTGQDEIKTLHDLIAHAVQDYGYDGLVNASMECGCRNGALMPCDGYCIDECRPGYIGPPDEDARLDGADWCIYATKQDRDNAVEKAGEADEAPPETSDPNGYAVEWLRQVAQGCNGGEDALKVNAPLIVAEIDRLEAENDRLKANAPTIVTDIEIDRLKASQDSWVDDVFGEVE